MKRKAEAEEEEEERLSNRPAWVLDNNLCYLWSEWALSEDTIPEEVRLTAEAVAQVQRLCQWAKGQVAQLELELEQEQQPPQQPVAVTAVAFATPVPRAAAPPVPVVPVRFDPDVLAQVAALKAGPRVGPSPATVLEM